MSEEIRILEIETENYRQYGGINTIEFPQDQKGFQVIIGENGAGKSNILNAINWCFYKIEPHQKKNDGKIIINDNYLKNLEIGHEGLMSVKVKLKLGETEYHISRFLKIFRGEFQYDETNDGRVLKIEKMDGHILPAGCEVQSGRSTFEITRRKSNEKQFHSVEGLSHVKMREILPKELVPYFLLDGEYLENFWTELSSIKIAITQISQLHLLESASNHIGEMKKRVPNVGSHEIDSLTSSINQNQYIIDSRDSKGNEAFSDEMRWNYDQEIHENETYHATGKLRIEELTEDVERLKAEELSIAEKYAQSGAEVVKRLETEQRIGKEVFSRLGNEFDNVKKQYISSQISNGSVFLLLPAIRKTLEIVDDLRIKGELPYEAKKIFTNDLLERNKCICGIDLESKMDGLNQETNSHRKNVEMVRNSMEEDQGLDIGVKMKYHFEEKIISDIDGFLKKAFDDTRKRYSEVREESKQQSDKNREIMVKLQNYSGTGDVSQLAKDQEAILNKISEYERSIKDEEYKIKSLTSLIAKDKIERSKKLSKDSKTKKIAFEQIIWEKISGIIETTFLDLKEEIRENVAKTTFKIFTDIMYKDDSYFKRFTINDKYEAQLIDQEDAAILGSLSAGERLFLSLAFISAIKEITGYKFPLVIDTPLGRVSGKPRFLLSQALPKYLPEEQLIFLATDTEFLGTIDNWDDDPEGHPNEAFGEMLEKQIPITYKKILLKDGNTSIMPYQPKWSKMK